MSHVFRYSLLLILLLGPLHTAGLAQTLTPRMSIFGPEAYGGGHSQVLCTVTLPEGRTAFGTHEEVLIHHGEGFDHVFVGSGKAVFSIDQGPSGRIYVGGSSLMGVITPDSTGTLVFNSLIPLLPDSLQNISRIWDTHCTPDGEVYFDALDRLFYYKGDSIQRIQPEERFLKMSGPGEQPLIQDMNTGIFRLKGPEKERIPGSPSFVEGKRVRRILPAPGDSTWTVFTPRNGIYSYDPSDGSSKPLQGDRRVKSLKKAFINTAARLDPDRNPYGAAYVVGTRLDGLYLLRGDGRILLHLAGPEGLPSEYIWQVAPDGQGNVWVGTNSGIVLLHTGTPFAVTEKGALFSGVVSDLVRPSEGGPLFLASSQGSWYWNEREESFLRVPATEGQCFEALPLRVPGREQRILVAGGNAGLLSLSVPEPEREGPSDADTLWKGECYALSSFSDPCAVLFGGQEGVFALSPKSGKGDGWKERLALRGLPGDIASMETGMMPRSTDSLRLWVALRSKGVLDIRMDTELTGARWSRYDSTDGLPSGPTQVFGDPDGEGVLIGTDQGLYKIQEGRFRPCSRYGNLFSDGSRRIFRFKGGAHGEAWVAEGDGRSVMHLRPEGDAYRIDSTVFRALDLGVIRSFFPEEERTWMGGDRGLACYFPGMEKNPKRAWHCRLRRVHGSRDSLLFGGSFGVERETAASSGILARAPVEEQPEAMIPVLPYSKNRLEFEYAAPYPDRQEAVTYRYKLEGFDTAWSEWAKEPKKEYTNLPEGSYTFKVKARNIYRKESSTAEYRFRILPPWYRTKWAYAGYGLTGVLIVSLFAWMWVRKRRADRQAKEYLQGLERANVEIREEKEKVEEAHQEITQSIDYAQKIQDALLKSKEHVSPHLPEHFILFEPQAKVSGDFYWTREHKGYFYIATVDCTGHGIPGAFMSMLGISQLNEIMNTDEVPTPGEILTELRERVVRELSGSDPESAAKDGMDAAILKIPLDEQVGSGQRAVGNEEEHPPSSGAGLNPHRKREKEIQIQFAGAQNPLYVIRKGIADDGDLKHGDLTGFGNLSGQGDKDPNRGDPSGLEEADLQNRLKPFKKSPDGIEIKGDHMPVGYDEYAKDAFKTVKLQLRKGDMLYIFSDGYADQFGGPKGKKFRYGPFKQLLADIHERPLEEQKQELDKTFEDWKAEGQQEQIDDVVVVGVRL